jgi:hypothetical protein
MENPSPLFEKYTVYCDIKARPVDHFKAFHRLVQVVAVLNLPVFN